MIAAMLLAASSPVAVFGAGNWSCARAMEPMSYGQAYAWVMGYVTGRNVAEQAQVGGSTDGDGVMGVVKLLCEADPSLSLTLSAERAYTSLQLRRR